MPLYFMCNRAVSPYTLWLSLATGSVDKERAHGHCMSCLSLWMRYVMAVGSPNLVCRKSGSLGCALYERQKPRCTAQSLLPKPLLSVLTCDRPCSIVELLVHIDRVFDDDACTRGYHLAQHVYTYAACVSCYSSLSLYVYRQIMLL
jgi:hypothetical protein